MADPVVAEKSPVPEMALKFLELEKRVAHLEMQHFVLRYKHRGAPKMLEFQAKDLEAGILRGRQHCQVQGYKFIYVEPVHQNLDELDKRLEDQRRKDIGEPPLES